MYCGVFDVKFIENDNISIYYFGQFNESDKIKSKISTWTKCK
jgi:hypothetical protein